MYVSHEDALKFMFNINKAGREFLINNFTAVRNGFTNEGLIDLYFEDALSSYFNNFDKLEKLYF